MIRRHALATVAALVTFAVLAGGGTAAAAWNATASIASSASSTTIASTLAQSGQLNTAYRYAGNASAAVTGSLTIANSGNAPLTYTLANQVAGSATLAQKTSLILWTGTCGSTIPTTGTVTTTLADPAPALPAAARTLAAGASITVCVATRIAGGDASASNAALQGQSATAVFGITGAVGTSWTTTATTSAITQSVYRLAAATGFTCAQSGRNVALSWAAPANRTAGSNVTYRVYDTASGSDVATLTSSVAQPSVTVDTSDITRNGSYSLAVEAKETTSGTSSPVSTTLSVTRTTPFNLGLFFASLSCS